MKLKEILNGIDCTVIGDENVDICGIAYDSRKVEKGDLFIAVRGFATDGHKFIDGAIERGAAAVLCEERVGEGAVYAICPDSRAAMAKAARNFYGDPSKELKMIGVTGTNGKTTCTYLIREILALCGYKCGVIGTNKIMINDREIPAEHTTPESLDLQALLRQMVDAGVNYVVMEVSSHSLVLGRVAGIEFEVGVFTNLTEDHLDFHKTMDEYARAKALLFGHCKCAVINADDEYAAVMKKGCTGKISTYSVNRDSDLRAENISMSERGVIFDIKSDIGARRMRLGIPGRFSVYNALASIGACRACGMSDENIEKGLVIAKGVKGRMEVMAVDRPYTVIIDYAHTPDALENVINTVRGFVRGRIITVFGCGGDRDPMKRPIMGEIAARLSDFSVITSDNPRSEDPKKIIDDILEGIPKDKSNYAVVENRRDAIARALSEAEPGDIVLLAGKGHETYQILSTGKIDFDERKVVREILEAQN